MRLNTIVNGLIGAGFALAPLNANAQTTPTSFHQGSFQYTLLERVANDAFSQGKVTPYKRGTDATGWKEGNLYRLTFVGTSGSKPDTLGVEVYDWDKNKAFSVGDDIAVGKSKPMTSLSEDNPWYTVTQEGVTINPSNSATNLRTRLLASFVDSGPSMKKALLDQQDAQLANTAYTDGMFHLMRLEKYNPIPSVSK